MLTKQKYIIKILRSIHDQAHPMANMLATMSSSTARKMEILMALKFLYYASKLKERKMRTVRLSY